MTLNKFVIVAVVSIIAAILSIIALMTSLRLEGQIKNQECLTKFRACEDVCDADKRAELTPISIAKFLANRHYQDALRVCQLNPPFPNDLECENEAGAEYIAAMNDLNAREQSIIDAYRFCRLECAKKGVACQQLVDIRDGALVRIPGDLRDLDGDGKLDMLPVAEICKRIGGGVCGGCYRSLCPSMDVAIKSDIKDFLIIIVNLNLLTGKKSEMARFAAKDGIANILIKESFILAPEQVLGFEFIQTDGSAVAANFEVMIK
jgi:hypothetical protein